MRNKDLKRLIKDAASKVEIPDKRAEILKNVNHKASVALPKRKSRTSLYFSLGGALVLASLLILFIVGMIKTPAPTPTPTPTPGGGTAILPTPDLLAKRESVMKKEVVALANVVEGLDLADNKLLALLKDSDMENTISYEEASAIANEINSYLFTSALFIADNIESEIKENDNPAYSYSYKMEVRLKDKLSYIMYYSESVGSTKTNTKIEGVIIIDSNEYKIEGEREDEGDEVELYLKVYLNESTYIKVENETELNENEFEYTYVVNDVIVKGVSLEVETENGVKEASIEIIKDNKKEEYSISYNSDSTIEVEYQGRYEGEILITKDGNSLIYSFIDTDIIIRLEL